MCEVGGGRTSECSVRASERRGHVPIIPSEELARAQRRVWVEPFIKDRIQQVGRNPFLGKVMVSGKLGADPTDLTHKKSRVLLTYVRGPCKVEVMEHVALSRLKLVVDPTERAQKALALIEEARTIMEQAAEVRARATLDLYRMHGAAKAARLLGTSRVNLYRILGQIPEVRQQRLNRTIEVTALAASVLASSGRTEDPQALGEGVNIDEL